MFPGHLLTPVWTLLTTVEQPVGFNQNSYATQYPTSYQQFYQYFANAGWIQGSSEGPPLSPEPARTGEFHVNSLPWASLLTIGKSYWLRFRFYKGFGATKTAECDVAYQFTYQGSLSQSFTNTNTYSTNLLYSTSALTLTNRMVITDTTGIVWTSVSPVYYWLPFGSSYGPYYFMGCNGYSYSTYHSCTAWPGTAGVIYPTSNANDALPAFMPLVSPSSSPSSMDIVLTYPNFNTVYGQTSAPNGIFLSIYLSPA